jgi:hypothetical protein
MQSKLNALIGTSFKFGNIRYDVLKVKIINQKAVITTKQRTFAFLPSQLDSFLESIEVITKEEFAEIERRKQEKEATVSTYVQKTVLAEKQSQMAVREASHEATVMEPEEMMDKVSNSLMGLFNELAKGPTDMQLEKAKAMVAVSNSICKAQMVGCNVKMVKMRSDGLL